MKSRATAGRVRPSCYSECVLRVSCIGALLAVSACFGQNAPLLDVLRQELDRNFSVLKEKGDPAAYFIQYSVTEQQSETYGATF